MVGDRYVTEDRQAQAQREVGHCLGIAPRRIYDGDAARLGCLEVDVHRFGPKAPDDLQVAHFGQDRFVNRLRLDHDRPHEVEIF